tara:strand:+ start:846 stop:1268 length:423 start_codon:yes stop_codon:yes gene_type:complete
VDCDLSNSDLSNSAFKEVHFESCKMLGLNFKDSIPFLLKIDFYNCNLSHSSFFKLPLKNSVFKNCNLEEVDFEECDLSSANFSNSKLLNAQFYKSKLLKTDFSKAMDFSINPEDNFMKGAIFNRNSLEGLLHNHKLKILD